MSSAHHHFVFRAVCIVFIPQPFYVLPQLLFIHFKSPLVCDFFFPVYVCVSSTCRPVLVEFPPASLHRTPVLLPWVILQFLSFHLASGGQTLGIFLLCEVFSSFLLCF